MLDDPWAVTPDMFPAHGSDEDKLLFLLNYAVLAPSGHNTQPWLFRVQDQHVDVIADRTRALPVVDPHDRALVISCGAAIGMLRTAIRSFGYEERTDLLPDAADPDLLASVHLGRSVATGSQDRELLHAIPRRRSTRLKYEDQAIPQATLAEMTATAAQEGATLHVFTDPGIRERIAELVAEGDRIQFADPSFRRELGSWVHSRRLGSRDGMSGANFGMPDILSPVGGLVIRTFDMGKGVAAHDRDIAVHSPALAVLTSAGDTMHAWLVAGQALARFLLVATAAGLTGAYLNQPIEVAALRPKLRDAIGATGFPLILMRLGYGPEIPPAVRRPVEAVLIS